MNVTAQQSILAIVLIIVYGGFLFAVPSKLSFLAGSVLVYIMCSLVFTKMKNEYIEQMNAMKSEVEAMKNGKEKESRN